MIGILIITVTALILSIILVLVEDSDSDKKILEALPGLNCGACGFGSCRGMVEAIKKDKNNYSKCRPLRGEMREKLEKLLNIK